MEAVKQGSATVGLKSNDYAVLVALKVNYFYVFPRQYNLVDHNAAWYGLELGV